MYIECEHLLIRDGKKLSCQCVLLFFERENKMSVQYHEVAAGETLSAIAKMYYGDANKYMAIFEANRDKLNHPDEIFPGQTLSIPALGAGQIHVVASGETLSAIAKQYYGNANKYNVIFEANQDVLDSPDRIFPGQKLRIP